MRAFTIVHIITYYNYLHVLEGKKLQCLLCCLSLNNSWIIAWFVIPILFFFFFFFNKFIYLFIFGCVGCSFLCEGFLQFRRAGATLHRGAWASHCHGLSHCGAQAPDAQTQQLWITGLAALRHVGPGLEPMSPALAGRFLTTAPPGKPPILNI